MSSTPSKVDWYTLREQLGFALEELFDMKDRVELPPDVISNLNMAYAFANATIKHHESTIDYAADKMVDIALHTHDGKLRTPQEALAFHVDQWAEEAIEYTAAENAMFIAVAKKLNTLITS